MKAYSYSPLLPVQRSAYAPALIASYALGATLWAPALVVVAEIFAHALAWFRLELPLDTAQLFAVVWTLRFALYAIGAGAGWNYGYGVNGVIVNRGLSLAEKARRLATDWFGIVLIAIWLWFMPGALDMAFAG
jgi:hypothetical protein